MKKIVTVVGSRPQFIKSSVLSLQLKRFGFREIIVHTGQHYDANMSGVFFRELKLPRPAYQLKVGSGTHAEQTGRALMDLEKICCREKPGLVLVYGDTNATLSGALAAAKLKIPLAHVEAGLRSFDRGMPEEVNRVVADSLSSLLFCPTKEAVKNLRNEGVLGTIHKVGDVMYDAALFFGRAASSRKNILSQIGVKPKQYVLATIHRDFNTDQPQRLRNIIRGLMSSGQTVVFPAHPRVFKELGGNGLLSRIRRCPRILLMKPVGYLEMICLETSAKAIVTDSGGVQKEAFFYRIPCLTTRPSTEWVETVQSRWNTLVDDDSNRISRFLKKPHIPRRHSVKEYGDGFAAKRIARILSCA